MKRILVVDDDITNLAVTENALSKWYDVVAVSSGAQALRFLQGNLCDLILLDINMPNMGGFEVLGHIRANENIRHIPVIFLTAENDSETENRCLEAGAVDYIMKPYAVKVLHSRISRTLELEELRSDLMKKVEEKTERIKKLGDNIVKSLAHTIDAKDRYTKGHSSRVAEYARLLAGKMGKSCDEQEIIYRAGLLHDVGKIRVPEEIINKAGRLSEEEFDVMKLHPITGYHILKDISENEIFSDCARFHHERYDGSGYPNGLAGDRIPEIARIVGVADAYDAMTSNRSYRTALTQEAVRGELMRGRGTQFDPKITDIMLRIMDEDKEYRLRETETNNKKILIVDDEPVNIKFAELTLRNIDTYTVKGAESGKAALDMLRAENFDIVLLDVRMPETDGYETAEKIREFSDIPIVFLTADKLAVDTECLKKYRASDFITRPFKPAALMEILHAVLSEQGD